MGIQHQFSSRNQEVDHGFPDKFAYDANKVLYEALYSDIDPRDNYCVEIDTMIQNEYRQRLFNSGIHYSEDEFQKAYSYARYELMEIGEDYDLMGHYPQYEDVLEALLLLKEE